MRPQPWYKRFGGVLFLAIGGIISFLLTLLPIFGWWAPLPQWVLTSLLFVGFVATVVYLDRRWQQERAELRAQIDRPELEIANVAARDVSLANWFHCLNGQYFATMNPTLTLAAQFDLIHRSLSPASVEIRMGGLYTDWPLQNCLQMDKISLRCEVDGRRMGTDRFILAPNSAVLVKVTLAVPALLPLSKLDLAQYGGLRQARLDLDVDSGRGVYDCSVDFNPAYLRECMARALMHHMVAAVRTKPGGATADPEINAALLAISAIYERPDTAEAGPCIDGTAR